MWQYKHVWPLELYHYGIKGMKWGVRRTKEELRRVQSKTSKLGNVGIYTHKSVGAKLAEYKIFDPETGEYFRFAKGAKLQDTEVFAGNGVSTSLRPGTLDRLCRDYGGSRSKWQHCKAKTIVEVEEGKEERAEVHWFQEPSVGKFDFKVKIWLDQ